MSRRKARTALVIVALSFSMAIMISIPAGIMANQSSTQGMAESFNDRITEMQEQINQTSTLIECQTSGGYMFSEGPPGGGDFPGGPPIGGPFNTSMIGARQETFINETTVNEISSIEGIKDVLPSLQASSSENTSETISGPGGRTFTISRPLYTISGVYLNASLIDTYKILPTNITAGRNLLEGDSGVLVMSQNLTDYFGVEIGHQVQINAESFTIVGTCDETGAGQAETRMVYMNISDAQRVTDNMGNVSDLDIYAQDTSYVDGIAEAIEVTYSELQITTYKDRLIQLQNIETMYEQTLTNAQSTLVQTQTIATQEIIIAVAATSLIILFVMLYTVRERTKEIGTLKAIGFSNWNVMSQFVLEGVSMSLVAAAVGIGIAVIGAPVFTSLLLPSISSSVTLGGRGMPGGQSFVSSVPVQSTATAPPDLTLMLLMLGVAALLGALGALYPAWRAAKTSPMEALRHE
jgi:putative ABC transport system permease protein